MEKNIKLIIINFVETLLQCSILVNPEKLVIYYTLYYLKLLVTSGGKLHSNLFSFFFLHIILIHEEVPLRKRRENDIATTQIK